MRRIFGGATLVVAGIAAFIEAHAHRTEYGYNVKTVEEVGLRHAPRVLVEGRLSQTPYDLLLIGAWALVIFGALIVAVGLIAYARSP